jgi:hypothetical protein
MHEEDLSEYSARRISSPGGNRDSLFIIFLKIDYVKDLLKKSKCDIL